MDTLAVGVNFVDAMKVSVVEGRSFSADVSTDMRETVLVIKIHGTRKMLNMH